MWEHIWKLMQVKNTEWIQDESGYYTLINWIDNNNVRLDWMDENNNPVISFQGRAENVRKHSMRFAENEMLRFISLEHAAYIGAELARCELLKEKYIQD